MFELINKLSKENRELKFSIDDYLDEDSDIYSSLKKYINGLSDKEIKNNTSNHEKHLYKHDRELYNIRKQAAINILSRKINEKRIQYLKVNDENPLPYSKFDSVSSYDNHYLMDINEFDKISGRYIYKDKSYTFMPSRTEMNSMYFLYRELVKMSKNDNLEIGLRLDPLIEKNNGDYYFAEGKMQIYGKPLNWSEINNLDNIIHTRFQDEKYNNNERRFTDLIWKRVDNEVHFICEELPKSTELKERGSRYFHSIYLPKEERFIHVDGAIRIYNNDEFNIGQKEHVRKTGKIGKRVKLFKVNGNINKSQWSKLVQSFFFMNDDVFSYFNKPK